MYFHSSSRRARGEGANKAVDQEKEGGEGDGRSAGHGGLQTQRHSRLATKGSVRHSDFYMRLKREIKRSSSGFNHLLLNLQNNKQDL